MSLILDFPQRENESFGSYIDRWEEWLEPRRGMLSGLQICMSIIRGINAHTRTYLEANGKWDFEGIPVKEDNEYSPASMGYYKYAYSESAPTQYYTNSPSYDVFHHLVGIDEYSTRDSEFPSAMINEQTRATYQQSERVTNTNIRTRNRDWPRNYHNSQDYQAIWQDNIDPDHMSYEVLLELGETVGAHSRGLSHAQICLLPVSKFRCCFLRRKSKSERCVICQMEYKRGARLITLPCKHKYHVGCATKWLSINKACPICYTEVSMDATMKSK